MLTYGLAVARWKVVGVAWSLDLRLRRLRREEAKAHERVGRCFRAAARPDASWAEPVVATLARVLALEEHERALAQRLAASLEADRRDYRAMNAELGRWLIVVRGILDRLVVRDEAWRAKRELPASFQELGARVMADPAAAEALPADERASAATARQALRDATRERDALLRPYGGQALPSALCVVAGECAVFFVFLWDELTKKVYLRLPALAAMGAAWWVTQRFTSSRREARLAELMAQGRSALSQDAIDWLSFTLPILAAALVAYLISALGKRVERRYLGNGEAEQK